MLELLVPSAGLGPLDDLDETPGLAARHRPAGRDRHGVALTRFLVLIVREQLGGTADELAVARMTHQPLDLDGDRLLHLGADHAPREGTLAFLFCAHDASLTSSARPRRRSRAARSSGARCCAGPCRTDPA